MRIGQLGSGAGAAPVATGSSEKTGGKIESPSEAGGSDRAEVSPPEEEAAVGIPNFSSWAQEICGSDPGPVANVTERTGVSVAYSAPAETRDGPTPKCPSVSKTMWPRNGP